MKADLSPIDRDRLENLLLAGRDKNLPAEERVELNHLLRHHPEARQHAAQFLFDDAALADLLRESQAEALFSEAASPAVAIRKSIGRPGMPGWLQWRPLTAAAAGLMLGMFCTSVVQAISNPHAPVPTSHSLPLTNASFEEHQPPLPDGVPVRRGIWSGDFAEIETAQQNITPKEGRQMLRFLRSDSTISSEPDTSSAGNMYQVVDVRPYRSEFADGQARVDWSAWFNWVPGENELGMTIATNVWAFTGDTSILPFNWKDHLYQETAKSGQKKVADATPRTWLPLSGSMIVPPDTDFLVIELKVIPRQEQTGKGCHHFGGCFADAVRLILRSYAPQSHAIAVR